MGGGTIGCYGTKEREDKSAGDDKWTKLLNWHSNYSVSILADVFTNWFAHYVSPAPFLLYKIRFHLGYNHRHYLKKILDSGVMHQWLIVSFDEWFLTKQSVINAHIDGVSQLLLTNFLGWDLCWFMSPIFCIIDMM